MGSEFAKRLSKLKGNWNKAKERKGGGFESAVEDGIYKMCVTVAELTERQSSGRLQIHWEFTVMDGEFKGEAVHDYDGMESEDNLFFIQRKVTKLGHEAPEDPSEIEEILAAITKEHPVFRGRVKTKDDFTHVHINKLLEGEESGAEDADPEPAAESGKGKADAEESGEVALEQGMKVTFKSGGKVLEGEILEFTDDDTKARVKTAKGTFKVSVDLLDPVAGEVEPEDPEPEPEAEPEPEPEPEKPARRVGSKGRVVASRR